MVIVVVPHQSIEMIIVGEFDSEGFLPSERFDVDDAKSNIDFDNRAKYVAINAVHGGRRRGRLLLVGRLVGIWGSGKRKVWVIHCCKVRSRGI